MKSLCDHASNISFEWVTSVKGLQCRNVELCLSLSCVSRDGICFAFQPPEEGLEQNTNVNFLEILSEFSFKLLQEDRSKL